MKSRQDWSDNEQRKIAIRDGMKASGAPKAAKLSDEQVLEIRELFTQWVPVKEIAAIYKVDPMIIHHIKAGRTYKYVGKES